MYSFTLAVLGCVYYDAIASALLQFTVANSKGDMVVHLD